MGHSRRPFPQDPFPRRVKYRGRHTVFGLCWARDSFTLAFRTQVTMARFFIAGNFWLIAAVALVLGRTVARTQPLMYSFFGVGGWYYPATYNLCIGLCAAFGIACCVLAAETWRHAR